MDLIIFSGFKTARLFEEIRMASCLQVDLLLHQRYYWIYQILSSSIDLIEFQHGMMAKNEIVTEDVMVAHTIKCH